MKSIGLRFALYMCGFTNWPLVLVGDMLLYLEVRPIELRDF